MGGKQFTMSCKAMRFDKLSIELIKKIDENLTDDLVELFSLTDQTCIALKQWLQSTFQNIDSFV